MQPKTSRLSGLDLSAAAAAAMLDSCDAIGGMCARPLDTLGHSGPERTTVDQSGPQWTRVDHSGPEWATVDHSGPQWTRVSHIGPWYPTADHSGPH